MTPHFASELQEDLQNHAQPSFFPLMEDGATLSEFSCHQTSGEALGSLFG